METSMVVDLGRRTLETAVMVAVPLLVAATAVSLIVNVVQVLTSLQETTISTVPRLMTVGAAGFLLMPWMVRRLGWFTLEMLRDFRPWLR